MSMELMTAIATMKQLKEKNMTDNTTDTTPDTTVLTVNTTPVEVEAEPPIIQAGFDAPIPPALSVDDAINLRIATALSEYEPESPALDYATIFDNISDDVYNKATEAIAEWDFSADLNDAIDNYMSYEFRPSDHDIITRDDFDPADFDLVTEYDVQDIKETVDELTSALDDLSDKAEDGNYADATEVQASIDTLQSDISDLSERIDYIVETIREFGANL